MIKAEASNSSEENLHPLHSPAAVISEVPALGVMASQAAN